MIGILQNQNLTHGKMSEIVEWHWDNIKNLIGRKKKSDPGIAALEEALAPVTFEEIVKADYAALSEYVKTLPHETLNSFLAPNGRHYFIGLYENFRNRYGMEFVERLELTVCPYCNRNYINNGKRNTSAQFDHFLPKSAYPIFALSFYNLIPCCSVCNHIKGEREIGVSPYDKTTTDALLRFGFVPKEVNVYSVSIDALQDRMNSNIEVLDLEALYAKHDDLLNELILKSKTYPMIYRSFLEKLFRKPQRNGMTAEEFYFGTYLTEGKYYLRPLSKFTHDIIAQLKDSE